MKIAAVSGPEDAVAPGTVIDGRYRIVEYLGAGGMGAVYRARHESIGRDFALKLLRPDLALVPALEERFNREARSAALLDDPRIVRVTDFGRTGSGLLYMVQELVEGERLSDRLRAGRLSPGEAIDIALQILAALTHAHERGVIHRDLKPDNVMLARRSGAPEVKLLDFGLAKVMAGGQDNLTQAGTVLGTPRYMSPEQAAAEELDARSDIYSVGVVLYEMLAGHPPFSGAAGEVMIRHVMEAPEPLGLAPSPDADVAALEAAVLRALEKRPEARFPDAAAFGAALAAARQPGAAAPTPAPDSGVAGGGHSPSAFADTVQTPGREGMSAPPEAPALREDARLAPGLRGLEKTPRRHVVALAAVAAGALSAALVLLPRLGADDRFAQAEAALAAGDVARASHLADALAQDEPDDHRVHLLHGKLAFTRDRPAEAAAAYARAVELSPEAAADPRLSIDLNRMIARRDADAAALIDAIAARADDSALPLLVQLSQDAPKPAQRRAVYEALERLKRADELERFAYLSAELAKNPTDSCPIRRWYVERLIALDDPRADPILRKELARRSGPLGLPINPTASCMEDLIRAALDEKTP